MKKIIIVLFIFMLMPSGVFATEWQEEKLDGDNVITEYRYKFYRLEKHGEYLNYKDANKYEYFDEYDIKYGEFGEWISFCPYSNFRDIEYGTKYRYKEILPVKYIKILNTGTNDIIINNISLYVNGDILNYSFNVYDKYDTTNKIIASNGYLIIKLDKPTTLKDITLNIDTSSDSNFNILFSYSNIVTMDKLIAIVSGNNLIKNYKYNKKNYTLYNNYTDELTSYNLDIDEFVNVVSTESVCRSREKKIFNYNLEKVYYDENYYKDISDLPIDREKYTKDFNSYKIYYKYMDEDIEDKDNELLDIEDSELSDTNLLDNELEDTEYELPVKTGIDNKVRYSFCIYFIVIFISTIFLKNKSIKKWFQN